MQTYELFFPYIYNISLVLIFSADIYYIYSVNIFCILPQCLALSVKVRGQLAQHSRSTTQEED